MGRIDLKGQSPRIVVPKTQISAATAAWTANDFLDISNKFPILPVNRLLVTLFADNVTDEATYAELLSELLNTIYIKSTKLGVLVDITGADLEQILRHVFGVPQLPVTGGSADNSERSITYEVLFGRNEKDVEIGLPAHAIGSMTVKHQLGTSSGLDGADYKVEADCLDMSPKYCFSMATISDTPAATGKKKYLLPSTGLYRGILLFGTTAYEAGAIKEPSLYLNQKSMDFDVDTIPLLARNFFDKKYPIVGVADLLPRIEEGLNNLTKYYFIDFGEDIDGMLNPIGKQLELQLNVATAEALRIIPIIALKC